MQILTTLKFVICCFGSRVFLQDGEGTYRPFFGPAKVLGEVDAVAPSLLLAPEALRRLTSWSDSRALIAATRHRRTEAQGFLSSPQKGPDDVIDKGCEGLKSVDGLPGGRLQQASNRSTVVDGGGLSQPPNRTAVSLSHYYLTLRRPPPRRIGDYPTSQQT